MAARWDIEWHPAGDLNFASVAAVLDNDHAADILGGAAGTLVLSCGRNSMHRITPAIGGRTRILVVPVDSTEPGIALSEAARMTFYGRLG